MERRWHLKRMSSPERPTMTTLILCSIWTWMDDYSQEGRERVEAPWLRWWWQRRKFDIKSKSVCGVLNLAALLVKSILR